MDEKQIAPAPLGRVTAFGNPFHGPIVNTTLTLSDDSTKTVPAPQSNDVFDFHVPGAPGGGTAIAPTGGEWRDYLLLYGNNNTVYGSAVNSYPVNWLFARDDGTRWMVSITSTVTGISLSSASLTIDLAAERFGDIGFGTSQIVAFSLTLSNRGLGATLPTEIVESLPSSVSIGLSDISPRGDKACLMFYASKSGTENAGQRFPYGFFEVTLSDSVFSSSSIALVHNIAAVAGTRRGAYYTDGPSPGSDQCTVYNASVTPSAASAYVQDAIMGCWYDSTEALTPVYFNYIEPLTSSNYSIYFGPNVICQDDYVLDLTGTASFSLSYGHANFGLYELTANHTYNIAGTKTYILGNGSYSESELVTIDAGATNLFTVDYSNSFAGENPPINEDGERNFVFSTFTTAIIDSLTYIRMHVSGARFHPWQLIEAPRYGVTSDELLFPPEMNDAPLFFAKRCAANLFIVGRTWADRTTYARKTVIDKAITKLGVLAVNYTVPDDTTLNQISAALQPVTGEIIIGVDSTVRAWV